MEARSEQVIRNFIAAWSRLDPAELADYFCDDGVYHNMMLNPVRGRTAIRAMISAFIKDWAAAEWSIVSLVSGGGVVIAERLDRTKVAERWIDLPCCGIFELQNGRIRIWRDYFDLATYTSAVTVAN